MQITVIRRRIVGGGLAHVPDVLCCVRIPRPSTTVIRESRKTTPADAVDRAPDVVVCQPVSVENQSLTFCTALLIGVTAYPLTMSPSVGEHRVQSAKVAQSSR